MTKAKKHDEFATTTDSSCVLNLMEAEKRARDLIDAAKKSKQATLKKARDDSNLEVEKFKKECDDNLKRLETALKNTQGNDIDHIEKDLIKKSSILKENYRSHSLVVLQDVLEMVVNVQVEYHQNFKN